MAPKRPEKTDDPTPEAQQQGEPLSKSQRKREVRVIFELSRDLVAMSRRQLEALPIEAGLLEEIELARSIRSNVARKRQVQFIAKKMRQQDVSAIQEALLAQENAARQMTVRHHRVESWRDRLINEGDSALGTLVKSCERTDIQALRNLQRNARRETELGKPPAAARKLFRLLREMDARKALPPLDDSA